MKNIFVLESQIYASLSHPKRLEILHLLSHEALSVNEIVKMTGVAQATVSQHLTILKKLKLVKVEKSAQSRVYSLASPNVASIFDQARTVLLERYGVRELDSLNKLHLHIDPICGMEVTSKGAASSLVHEHHRYYFCGFGCEKAFKKQISKIQNSNNKENYPSALK